MESNWFFPPHPGIRLGDLAGVLGASLSDPDAADRLVRSLSPVYRAGEGDLCYLAHARHGEELATCQATAILCDEETARLVPPGITVLLTRHAFTAFAVAGAHLYPQAMRPERLTAGSGVSPQAVVDPSARLEADVEVEAFAVVGAGAEIGRGTRIGAGAVIGPGVRIGRDCTVATGASVLCALVGNHVIIHPGARIGQDGFGNAPGPKGGMIKVVQIGRVILQDHVEVGANTTIDRGAMDDTVVGEGTKLDNHIQIAHNVRIGRYCGIASQVGIAGSTRIGDGVMIGGAAAINGHITIGSRAQIAAMSGVMVSVGPGERVGGIPARPIRDFLREASEIAIRSGARRTKKGAKND
ncbi:UDP-3-O-[3-hydroxymyristoyl] glucosamine N-acyltransferase [Rhizobium sp. RU20A]|uniref:UDP-3-O-(3-hydroxymyristoyl)glucosamine N-acyltransferase n=1 Tax=Rhizobium sp. RU20A TaxID=1907412 RepID=UPI0009574B88|nr:UDP-3-O-(3-hydroxymyristoyl)glucosamine N-acyltransferase [Rhizobium sp. RU20A]SIQ01185.1 UDP-3-O-[3-hydroxymyristoyl] glucosamine N-acyltransferase [Rhizobium sp. RU20A]